MHRRRNYRKPVTTKLPASVAIAMTGEAAVTIGATTGGTRVVVAEDVGNFVRSVAVGTVTVALAVVAIAATPVRAIFRSRRKACG